MNANVWTDETLIEAGSAKIASGAHVGQRAEIVAYAFGTVMVRLYDGAAALPFGLGEISEIHESKGDALALALDGRMPRFLKLLSDWAEANGTAGRTISAEPLAGPGIMVWRAK